MKYDILAQKGHVAYLAWELKQASSGTGKTTPEQANSKPRRGIRNKNWNKYPLVRGK